MKFFVADRELAQKHNFKAFFVILNEQNQFADVID
jgi:hypothetical protein